MLTKRQNLMEVMKGGKPDRFVNQYEFMEIIKEDPLELPLLPGPGTEVKNKWGITFRWPEGQTGEFPVHDDEHKVLKDVTKWKECVKAPSVFYTEEEWAPAITHANSVDRNDKFVTAFRAPGIFEMTYHLMGMENALVSLYEEPEAMQELIDYIVEYELACAKQVIDHMHPDALFHHDDWGSQISALISPKMFKEFFSPAYKKVYGFWKDNGVELIVHHSDCYEATLVPQMIEMSIDIWHIGAKSINNIPELIKKYGGQITFMGDIDSGVVDHPGWSREEIAKYVKISCKRCGKLYFIPCLSQGGYYPSSFPGVYDTTSEEIDRISKEMF